MKEKKIDNNVRYHSLYLYDVAMSTDQYRTRDDKNEFMLKTFT